MKKLLLILLCYPLMTFAQQTYVPDDNFEQELINLGYDSVLDDSVLDVKEHISPKRTVGILDIYGRATSVKSNSLLFYIYDDGTIEKKLIFD